MPMSKETIAELHRLRWGGRRSPSVQIRVDKEAAQLVWALPESERRGFLTRAIQAEYTRLRGSGK